MKGVSAERAAVLSRGEEESRTLTEGLAVDFSILMREVLSASGASKDCPMPDFAAEGILRRMKTAGKFLLETAGAAALPGLGQHRSDTVRGIVAFALVQHHRTEGIPALLSLLEPLADDPHFGVREWAWLAAREELSANLETSLACLEPWTASPRTNIRRFAVESLRPRGVWSPHIAALRQNPSLGLPLLEPLKQEKEKYVQDSVANWLNDAAKDQPDWVMALCERWLAGCGDDPATRRICTRARRSIK